MADSALQPLLDALKGTAQAVPEELPNVPQNFAKYLKGIGSGAWQATQALVSSPYEKAQSLYNMGSAIGSAAKSHQMARLLSQPYVSAAQSPEGLGEFLGGQIPSAMLGMIGQNNSYIQSSEDHFNLPLNKDGSVTVYHHTNPEAAAIIKSTGILKSGGEPDVYVTNHPIPDIGYGLEAVPIHVKPSLLQIDDEFPSGRRDFRINTGKPGGSVHVVVPK
jgi:hypothetical protein